jgi:5-methylcytosine-specific restriction endonuclease McrA
VVRVCSDSLPDETCLFELEIGDCAGYKKEGARDLPARNKDEKSKHRRTTSQVRRVGKDSRQSADRKECDRVAHQVLTMRRKKNFLEKEYRLV